MIEVLMIGNHPSNKGGMTSVINQIREHDWSSDRVDLSFIPTFLPGNPAKKALYFAYAYLRILARFMVKRPDIVHMHMSYKGSFTRKYYIHKLCKAFKVKDIIHLHGSEFEKWYYEVDDKKKRDIFRLLTESDAFVVLGETWRTVVKRIAPNANVAVISNGIEIPADTVHWYDDYCTVLFLGVLIPRKGVSDLIKAIKEIREGDQLGNLRFVIAGSGEEKEKLKNEVLSASVEDVVSFAGWVTGDKKKQLIKNSQIFVSPSYNEGLPISILEAASYGMPIVSTDVGDISSVVKDGVNGVLIQPGDIAGLSDGIMTVATRDAFSRMSKESRDIIEKSFSIESFYRKLSKLYHELGEADGKK